ncbi:MAG: hypothetical protein JRE12_12095 [Deltaproteobacteria bacterium]|nr:hypothetical protein [Deltaproteobacteria bacterium]
MNPFKILSIGFNASKKEIIQASARAMREKKYSGLKLAQAQKMLLDPVSRAVQEFLYCFDAAPFKNRLSLKRPGGLNRTDIATLTRLTIFDEEI